MTLFMDDEELPPRKVWVQKETYLLRVMFSHPRAFKYVGSKNRSFCLVTTAEEALRYDSRTFAKAALDAFRKSDAFLPEVRWSGVILDLKRELVQ